MHIKHIVIIFLSLLPCSINASTYSPLVDTVRDFFTCMSYGLDSPNCIRTSSHGVIHQPVITNRVFVKSSRAESTHDLHIASIHRTPEKSALPFKISYSLSPQTLYTQAYQTSFKPGPQHYGAMSSKELLSRINKIDELIQKGLVLTCGALVKSHRVFDIEQIKSSLAEHIALTERTETRRLSVRQDLHNIKQQKDAILNSIRDEKNKVFQRFWLLWYWQIHIHILEKREAIQKTQLSNILSIQKNLTKTTRHRRLTQSQNENAQCLNVVAIQSLSSSDSLSEAHNILPNMIGVPIAEIPTPGLNTLNSWDLTQFSTPSIESVLSTSSINALDIQLLPNHSSLGYPIYSTNIHAQFALNVIDKPLANDSLFKELARLLKFINHPNNPTHAILLYRTDDTWTVVHLHNDRSDDDTPLSYQIASTDQSFNTRQTEAHISAYLTNRARQIVTTLHTEYNSISFQDYAHITSPVMAVLQMQSMLIGSNILEQEHFADRTLDSTLNEFILTMSSKSLQLHHQLYGSIDEDRPIDWPNYSQQDFIKAKKRWSKHTHELISEAIHRSPTTYETNKLSWQISEAKSDTFNRIHRNALINSATYTELLRSSESHQDPDTWLNTAHSVDGFYQLLNGILGTLQVTDIFPPLNNLQLLLISTPLVTVYSPHLFSPLGALANICSTPSSEMCKKQLEQMNISFILIASAMLYQSIITVNDSFEAGLLQDTQKHNMATLTLFFGQLIKATTAVKNLCTDVTTVQDITTDQILQLNCNGPTLLVFERLLYGVDILLAGLTGLSTLTPLINTLSTSKELKASQYTMDLVVGFAALWITNQYINTKHKTYLANLLARLKHLAESNDYSIP